jgi:hypothetical protein
VNLVYETQVEVEVVVTIQALVVMPTVVVVAPELLL